MVEARVREADHSSGERVRYGSRKHVSDLKRRIKELASWRDRQKKGSAKRADYARLIQNLKAELHGAVKRAQAKQ